MKEINDIIGKNLKTLRDNRNLSLGQLAELSGISKTLLGQIEKGKNNPTINTLWKIANGLNIPYTVLLEGPPDEALVIRYPDAFKNKYTTRDKKCAIYYYYPYTTSHNYEFSGINLKSGGYYLSEGNLANSQEYIFIQQGCLTLIVNEQTYILNPGDSIHFMSSQQHEYRNEGTEEVKAIIYNNYV